MSSKEYWRKREDEALKHYIKDEKEYDKQIQRIYSDMLDSCQKEINAFYGKYADKENITIAEAKKRVSKLDIAEYERKAKRYVRDKDFSPKANEEMRLYNATMRINRLEMLKANIGLEMISGHNELEKFMGDILKGRTEEELERQAGILGKTITNNAKLANTIPNASFHNATFSDRVWQYQDLLKADLSKLLQSGMIQGKNARVLARELKDKFDVSTSNAERLMRTELARVQTEAQKQSFERNGFEEYEFIANSNCCDVCQSLNGKHFKVAKMMPGENAAPMHPHCRCSTAAYEDGKEYDAWLNYLDKGGTTEDWNKLSAEEKAKQIQNLTNSTKSDKIQSGKDDNSHSVVEGKDLSGKIDYTNSKFDYDIETAIHAQGFDGLPKVVDSQKDFDELMQKDHFLGERTIRADSKQTLDLYEHQLKNDYFYVNCGVGGAQYGQGMYCAADYSKGKISYSGFKHEIDTYTQGQQARTFWLTMDKSSKILTLPHGEKADEYIWARYRDNYLLKYSKGAEHEAVQRYVKAQEALEKEYKAGNFDKTDALNREIEEAKKHISDNLFKAASDNTKYYPTADAKYPKFKNAGTLAAEMGYDAINAEGHGKTGSYTVVLNRTKLIIYGGADYEYRS